MMDAQMLKLYDAQLASESITPSGLQPGLLGQCEGGIRPRREGNEARPAKPPCRLLSNSLSFARAKTQDTAHTINMEERDNSLKSLKSYL